MNPNFIKIHASQLLNLIVNSDKTANSIAKKYFLDNKGIGSKERHVVNELTYFSLRNYFLIMYLSQNIFKSFNYEDLVDISIALIYNDFDIDTKQFIESKLALTKDKVKFEELFHEIYYSRFFSIYNEIKNLVNILYNKAHNDFDHESLSIYYSTNIDIISSLANHHNNKELVDYLKGLSLKPILQIRVNSLKSDILTINKSLSHYIQTGYKSLSPFCVSLNRRTNLNLIQEYQSGEIEVQSDGSQIIPLLAYSYGQNKILDACAGAGGKSLQIAALSKNKAKIIATDIFQHKIDELIKRSKRANSNKISAFTLNNKRFRDLAYHEFDLVLIDAPCTGLGTAQRFPVKKFQIDNHEISKHQLIQLDMIKYYSDYVKLNGTLVYATCSILHEENELVVENFLSNNPDFELYEPLENLTNYNLRDKLTSKRKGIYRVHPLYNHTDGFFVALFKRKGI